jgi:hypothetical protein
MLFRSLRKLSTSVTQTLPSSAAENSFFSYLSKAGKELAETSKPTDLKSLVRVVSSVNSFRYPAFKPTLKKMTFQNNDLEWREKLQADASNCSHGKALEYLKVLSQSDVPQDILETLIKRVQVSTRKDLEDYMEAIKNIDTARLDANIRNASTYVVKSAINNNMRLSTYMSIWEMIHHHWLLFYQ